MKKILVIFLSILLTNISSAQSGWGYVNYTSYKTHNGNGSQNQYTAFADNAAGFDAMFNIANSNTTIYATGQTQIVNLYNGSLAVPRWSGDFYGYKFEFWFVPQETGTYWFGTNSDDASDILIDGVVVASYYGGHGASGYQTGSKSMIAGQRYRMVYRGQEFGGGDVFYFQWAKPSAPYNYSYWNNEVTNIESNPTKQVKMNFDFGSTLDETKFSVGGKALSSLGVVDVTNSIDSVKIGSGYKANTTAGQVEWCVIYQYDATNQRYRIGIDSREVNGILSDPTKISSLQLFDLWNGPVTFNSYDPNGWTEVYVYTQTQFNFSGSSFTPNIRSGNGFYGLQAEFTFTELLQYKPQSVTMTTTNTLSTLYNSIVTVSDVWLAFKEVANVGIFGNQTGNEFGYGIQYKNGDVNDDGYFNEADCFSLLQHLTGNKNLVDTFNLKKTLKLIPKSTYNTIGKSNWNTFPYYLGDTYEFNINTGKVIDTFNLSATWKGDVNLSHSAIPLSNGITTMSVRTAMSTPISNEINVSIVTEVIGDSIYAYITIDPLQQNVVGTQFQLNYDNSVLKYNGVQFTTKGSPTNYATDKGSYINLGSLVSDGSTNLDKMTTYKISFSSNTKLDNILGLISIGTTDAVNQSGKTLNVRVN